MQLLHVLGLCLAMATIVFAVELRFRDCGSRGAKVESLSVSQCFNEPCVVYRGRNYTSKVVFTPLMNSTTATSEMVASVFGRRFPLPMPKDACKFLKCPLIAGQQQTGEVVVPIGHRMPRIGVALQWSLYGDNRKKLFCISQNYRIR